MASGADAALNAIVGWVVGGAAWLLGELIGLIDSATRPDVRQGWFSVAYQDMATIAVLLMLPLLLVSITQAVVRQDLAHLVRAVFVYVPVATVGMFATVAIVDQLVILTDGLSSWIGRTTGSDLTVFSENVAESLAVTGATASGPDQAIALPGFATLLGAAVIGFASFVIWVLLVLRQAAIYVAVLFVPLGFAALVWPTTAHWLRRLLEGLVAIVMSKFVIVAVMGLGAGALQSVAEEGFGVLVSGGAMLLMAAFAPFVLLRFIPVFESGLASQMEGTTNGRTSPVSGPTAGGVYRHVQRARAASGGFGAAGLATAGAGVAGMTGAAASTGRTPGGNTASGRPTPAAAAGHDQGSSSQPTSGGRSGENRSAGGSQRAAQSGSHSPSTVAAASHDRVDRGGRPSSPAPVGRPLTPAQPRPPVPLKPPTPSEGGEPR